MNARIDLAISHGLNEPPPRGGNQPDGFLHRAAEALARRLRTRRPGRRLVT
ncbi:hypothetical protein [Saccharopolyspora sp. CA-218241]|uniref:hypothetical protein n=1 Tax=Saccharopolyspora sp. CA-218241 TaxID=3240027 RepID=UPI003D99B9D7